MLTPSQVSFQNLIAAWSLRLLLAALLFFGTDILLWYDPLGRSIGEWVLLIVGYIALGTLLLDLAARYRIRSLYEVMTLAAIFALYAGLLLYPERALADFPRTLVTRVVGAHALTSLEMLGLFLALTGGHRIREFRYPLLGFSLWNGFYWGIWMRWSPSLIDWLPEEVSLMTMFTVAGASLVVVLFLWIWAVRASRNLSPPELRLHPGTFGIVVIVLVVLLLIRIAQEVYSDTLPIPMILILVFACGVILWFQRTNKGKTLLDEHVPPQPLGWVWIFASFGIFCAATVFAYGLPLLNIMGYNQLSLMEYGFLLVGFGWFPVLAGVLGMRALERQSRKLNVG